MGGFLRSELSSGRNVWAFVNLEALFLFLFFFLVGVILWMGRVASKSTVV